MTVLWPGAWASGHSSKCMHHGSPSWPLAYRYFISHKPNKTWQQVFWFAISIAVNNAYILYKMSDAYHVSRYSRAQFGERLVRELLGLEDVSPAP